MEDGAIEISKENARGHGSSPRRARVRLSAASFRWSGCCMFFTTAASVSRRSNIPSLAVRRSLSRDRGGDNAQGFDCALVAKRLPWTP
jgi:hypothetical protein